MRLPRSLAWLLLILTFFTAGLLRQSHDRIFNSPFLPSTVGSLLFAAVLLLLLVAARERRMGAVRGKGVRLGSLTPLLLMLLLEKWVSLALYNPAFNLLGNADSPERLLDAQYRAFAGAGLLLVCLLLVTFSPPAARRTWRRASLRRFPIAAAATLLTVLMSYLILWGLAAALGNPMKLIWPHADQLWFWTFGGQAVRAFAEEFYYRGLILFEMQRLAPRLGVRSLAARRWTALLFSSFLFGMEHLFLAPTLQETGRRFIFSVCLGLLLGIIVLVSSNLHFAAGLHAGINWLLLGAAPYFVGESGESVLAPGSYIGLGLSVAFVLLFVAASRRRSRH